MRILNLYAGLGGNRKFWYGHDIVAVELDARIANVYKRLYPTDQVIIGDAHKYLIENSDQFDFIWSSPPCQSHSRMEKFTRHKNKRYPDMKLYEEIIYLQHFFKGKFVVENVIPYYVPLIPGKKLGRHMYWSNFDIGEYVQPIPTNFVNLTNLAGKKKMMDWLGIHYEESIYYGNNHCPVQILRNCVHPNEGFSILNHSYIE